MISNTAFTELRELLQLGHEDEARRVLQNMQAGYLALLEENHHLKLRLEALEELAGVHESGIHEREGAVWVDTPNGVKGPYCALCHSADGSLVRLDRDGDFHVCPSCQSVYDGAARERGGKRHATELSFREACSKLGL